MKFVSLRDAAYAMEGKMVVAPDLAICACEELERTGIQRNKCNPILLEDLPEMINKPVYVMQNGKGRWIILEEIHIFRDEEGLFLSLNRGMPNKIIPFHGTKYGVVDGVFTSEIIEELEEFKVAKGE